MIYTVYQTTNLVNGKMYIGVHKTKNPDDTYLGSNETLQRARKKYGSKNFQKEILFAYDNEEDAFNKEAELVTEEFCSRKDTYNIVPGGKGNSKFGSIVTERKIGIHAMTFEEKSARSKKTQSNLDPEYAFEIRSKAGKNGSKRQIENKIGIFGLSAEERKKNSNLGLEVQRKNEIGFFNRDHHLELSKRGGKIGGRKNKGFIWYTDGINGYKYTVLQQTEKSFEEFLNENPSFTSGRPFKKTGSRSIRGQRKFVTNGSINKQIENFSIDQFLLENPEFRLGITHINNSKNKLKKGK